MGKVAVERVEDITEEVVRFLSSPTEDGRGHSAIVPGLEVVAYGGVIAATQRKSDFDGCHGPYEWVERDSAQQYSVHELRIQGKDAEIRTNKGTIPADPESLGSYNFLRPLIESQQPSSAEAALRERLDAVPFLANVAASRLVGYENELLVSSRDQLQFPISVPPNSIWGHTRHLLDAPVGSLSLYEKDGTRVVTLGDINYSRFFRSPGTALSDVPMDEVVFNIRPHKNQPQVVLGRALQLAEQGSEPLFGVVQTFNGLSDLDQLRMLPEIAKAGSDPYQYRVDTMIGEVDRGEVRGLTPVTRETFQPYRVDRLHVDPRTHQLFLLDLGAGVALDAGSVEVMSERDANERYNHGRWRQWRESQ